MIEGAVNSRYEVVIPLELQAATGQTRQVEAVLDTGYNGYLVLPPSLVAEMGLPFVFERRAFLANGAEVMLRVHEVTVLWDESPRDIEVSVTGRTPLVGMRLLDGHTLTVNVKEGGCVLIEAEA